MYLEFFFSWAYLKKKDISKKKKKEVNMEIYNSIFYHNQSTLPYDSLFYVDLEQTIDEQNHI